MLFDIFVIFVQLAAITHAQPFYDIPAYYGHFSLRYFEPSFILSGKMVRLEYHFAADANYQNDTIYFADAQDHCVYQYSLTTQIITILVGQCGISGNIIGSRDLAIFNGVSSVAYFRQPSAQLLASLKQQSISIVSDSTCLLTSAGCTLGAPYPSLQMTNLRYISNTSLYTDQVNQREFLYISDTANHCIKKLSLTDNLVSVVAGKCGVAGFLDGPLGYNRLSSPTSLGVSREGVLYFFDSGNQYIRIVDLSGGVSSLLLGACKKFGERVVAGYAIAQILCYENWIEGVTQSAIKHYFDPAILNICTSQSSQCVI